MKNEIAITTNTKEIYAVVDSEGKVIEKFRGKATAINYAREQRKNYYCKLNVITKIDNKENNLSEQKNKHLNTTNTTK